MRIIVEVLLESRDALFQRVNFLDGALQGEAERIHGAFEAFEEVDTYKQVARKVMKDVKVVDCETMRLVTVSREVQVYEKVPTGKKHHKYPRRIP